MESSRSLRWERGLKYTYLLKFASKSLSLPSLGAWIEVSYDDIFDFENEYVAPFAGSVD